MRNLKKFLALVLAMMMALSLMVTVNASGFKDDDEINPAYNEAVSVLEELEIVQGDTGFRPKDTITRAEVAAILYRLYTGDGAGDYLDLYKGYTEFPGDVGLDKWYTPYVNFCYNNGLVKGTVDGVRFNPSGNITGYEALVMILRAIGYNNPQEFSSSDWKFKASGYGQQLGLTKNIATAALNGAITREMVAEIMYEGLQAPIVQYTMLQNYQPAKTLIANDADARADYAQAIALKVVELPLYENLLYRNWGIVGQSPQLLFDDFGRPSYVWVTDDKDDKMVGTIVDDVNLGNASKYVPNVPGKGETWGDMVNVADWDKDEAFHLTMTPLATYHNSVLECDLSKVIANDKTIDWASIIEVLNGNAEKVLVDPDDEEGDVVLTATGDTFDPQEVAYDEDGNYVSGSGHVDGALFDALHTSSVYVGATGRTTEVYRIPTGHYVFVYVDTMLGKVLSTTSAIKDIGGHTIRPATATVAVGAGDGYAEVQVSNSKGTYKKDDLVLIQTPHADMGENPLTDTERVSSSLRAPLYPTDVPNDEMMYTSNEDHPADTVPATLIESSKTDAIIAGKAATVRVTIEGTVGVQNAKMGIIDTKGITYFASNTFLAGRTGDGANKTVLAEYYDVDQRGLGITNSMIGRVYDLILDENDYIVGMKEVASAASVGVITGIDTTRVGTGKYLTTVEAFMTDGTTKSFELPKMVNNAGELQALQNFNTANGDSYVYYNSATASDDEWSIDDPGTYSGQIGIGSLVKFKQVTMADGYSAWCIDDWASEDVVDPTENDLGDIDFQQPTPGTTAKGQLATGVEDHLFSAAITGVANTLDSYDENKPVLNSQSVIFVAEYDYRYNTGAGNNDGSNFNKTYKVYNGFKTIPTIVGFDAREDENAPEYAPRPNVLWQRLQKPENKQYVLIYAGDPAAEYYIREPEKMPVDESYLVLSRDVTYAAYSEYTVLKNGVKETMKVANGNSGSTVGGYVNNDIEQAMINGQLITVASRNTNSGYVTGIYTADDMANNNWWYNVGSWFGLTSSTLDLRHTLNDDEDNIKSIADYEDGTDVLDIIDMDDAHHYLTIADNCKVLIVNLDQKITTSTDVATAVAYANGIGRLDKHNLTFELDANGYVCTLYVIE